MRFVAYIVNAPTRPVPEDVLRHIQTSSRLEHLHINTIPDDINSVCQLELEGSMCSVFVDLSVSVLADLSVCL